MHHIYGKLCTCRSFPAQIWVLRVDVRLGLRAGTGLQLILPGVYHAPVTLPLWHIIIVFYLLLVTAHTDNEQTTIAEYGARGLSQHDCQSLTR